MQKQTALRLDRTVTSKSLVQDLAQHKRHLSLSSATARSLSKRAVPTLSGMQFFHGLRNLINFVVKFTLEHVSCRTTVQSAAISQHLMAAGVCTVRLQVHDAVRFKRWGHGNSLKTRRQWTFYIAITSHDLRLSLVSAHC